MRQLLVMWKYPRMVAWFVLTVGLTLLFRLPFGPAQVIPYCLSFNPGVVFIPLAGVFFGPAGVWGSLAAVLLGDRLTGMWGPLTPYRAIGTFVSAYAAQRLWDAPGNEARAARPLRADWRSTIRFVIISVPGSFAAASWAALGTDLLRLYPFPYFASIVTLHNVIFVTLLGIPFYRIAARDFVPHWGAWRDVMEKNGRAARVIAPGKALALWVGGVGACCVGCLAGWVFKGIRPFTPFVLGTTCGWGVPAVVVPLLLLNLYGLTNRRLRQ